MPPRKKGGKTKESKAAPASANPESQGKAATVPGRFPVVGIGASAGGLAAIEAFFAAMPRDKAIGMAFVLVQHLSPDHKSILIDLVKRYTSMPVFLVEDGMRVRTDCVYIIPPNRDMALLNGKLELLEPGSPRGLRLPIDFFFRSLAQDRKELAICIVLSGTGTDGSLGLKVVKGEGGMAMAQTLDSAAYDGMPRSAILTGVVDYVLPPAKMPEQLIAYAGRAFKSRPQEVVSSHPSATDFLQKIFLLLRTRTTHDFSLYKRNTVQRRVERRMAVAQIERIEDYVHYLRDTPLEVDTLFRELLIGVTSFFRDPQAFESLREHVIGPHLSDASRESMRIWVPGCSTGEEAYSIAILIREHPDHQNKSTPVQIFATDIDIVSIERARAGVYPDSIAADVSTERLERFFTKDESSYRIHKDIRDMVVFAKQDVLKDPPFSKLDLITCRNLLIYLDAEAQKMILPMFHYALNRGGHLLLGNSESVGEFSELFAAVDKKWKLYRQEGTASIRPQRGIYLPPLAPAAPARWNHPKLETTQPVAARDLAEQALLEGYIPSSVLINSESQVLYIHGRTGKFLEPPSGDASLNLLTMARDGIRMELAAAVRTAAVQKVPVRYEGLQVKSNGDTTIVNLIVQPVTKPDAARGLLMVIFEDVTPPRGEVETATEPKSDQEQHLATLERELRSKEEYLQATIEELQTSNEELRSTNEEAQSANEELQSANEELETSREELQSLNEELLTVNNELQTKIEQLSQASDDMNNLLSGTNIGTIFVDRQMNIKRFTAAATQISNFIKTDVGRPVGDIVSQLVGYDRLVEDTQAVLDTLIPKVAEVQVRGGQWYQMKIQPYRTLQNVIEGAVLTFVEITREKELLESLRSATRRNRELLESIHRERGAGNPKVGDG
ncbi:MAG: CheR family methyltransferase [Desulfobacteria bacterium]